MVKLKSLISGLILGLIIGAAGMYYYQLPKLHTVVGTNNTSSVDADVVVNENWISYTAADFEDAILGKTTEHKELVVMEQELSVPTTITHSGLGNLQIFSKVKNVIYYGTGVYTVDLNKIERKNIHVDLDNKKVKISLPHAKLQYVTPDLSKTEFADTERGLLAFGEIKLTTEEQNELEQAIQQTMTESLQNPKLLEQADAFATMKTWEIFQPLVTAISPEFVLEVEFDS